MKKLLLIASLLSLSALLNAEAITEKNWQNHPDVKSIRVIFTDIEKNCSNGDFKIKEHSEDTDKIFYLRSDGDIAKMILKKGSEDSAQDASYYYDSKGNLRFIFITYGAVNGAKAERRVYVKNDKIIWENMLFTRKIGYPFPEKLPIQDMITKPDELMIENTGD